MTRVDRAPRCPVRRARSSTYRRSATAPRRDRWPVSDRRRRRDRRRARALRRRPERGERLEKVQAELQQFAEPYAGEPLAPSCAIPAIPARRRALAAAWSPAPASLAPLAKLILVLAEKDRLTLLPEIARAYAERVMDHLKIVARRRDHRGAAGAGEAPRCSSRGSRRRPAARSCSSRASTRRSSAAS